jgi:hypothetical protein
MADPRRGREVEQVSSEGDGREGNEETRGAARFLAIAFVGVVWRRVEACPVVSPAAGPSQGDVRGEGGGRAGSSGFYRVCGGFCRGDTTVIEGEGRAGVGRFSTVFKTAALNHSATPPNGQNARSFCHDRPLSSTRPLPSFPRHCLDREGTTAVFFGPRRPAPLPFPPPPSTRPHRQAPRCPRQPPSSGPAGAPPDAARVLGISRSCPPATAPRLAPRRVGRPGLVRAPVSVARWP